MTRFVLLTLIFGSAISWSCGHSIAQTFSPLGMYGREPLVVRSVRDSTSSVDSGNITWAKAYWSTKWTAFCGQQALTEVQFLETTGCFELAQQSRELRAQKKTSTTLASILAVAGAVVAVYGAQFYYKEEEIARVGNVSVVEKQQTPNNGFTYGGIAIFAVGLGLTISEAFASQRNLITFGEAQSLADKYNYGLRLQEQNPDSNRVRP